MANSYIETLLDRYYLLKKTEPNSNELIYLEQVLKNYNKL